jgi:hypothetical protein
MPLAVLKRSVQRALSAGDLFNEAKALVPHGQWLPWLKDHCGVPERTASLYMRLARNRQTIESQIGNVADLTIRAAAKLLAPAKADRELEAVAVKIEEHLAEIKTSFAETRSLLIEAHSRVGG